MRHIACLLLLSALTLPTALNAAPRRKPPAAHDRPSAAKILAATEAKTPLQAMIKAERDFSNLAGSHGTRDAFMANLADDGVLFRPLPVNGRENWQSRPPSRGTLVWAPAYAEMAASGDLGFTTGPWEYHPAADQAGAEIGYGDFLTVWRKGPDGWKVALDYGSSHAIPEQSLAATPLTAGPAHEAGATPDEPLDAGLLRTLEGSMSRMVGGFNASRAVSFWTAADLRYLHEGDPVRLGDDARNALGGAARRPTWHPMGFGVAGSADLGYTYGVREDSSDVAGQAPDSTVYVHIWRHPADGQWKIAAAVENPLHAK